MTDRLEKIISLIPDCEVFADIGCDHGYIAKQMLERKKCKKVVISDVSAKCLAKAEKLLFLDVKEGRATSFVSNGFSNLPCESISLALIAGMGGREIISILDSAKILPNELVLQPMKNTPEVRQFVVEKGYKILVDMIFYSDEKFYNLLVIKKGEDSLTQDEIEFGRTNILSMSEDFKKYVKKEIEVVEKALQNSGVNERAKDVLNARLKGLKKYDEH